MARCYLNLRCRHLGRKLLFLGPAFLSAFFRTLWTDSPSKSARGKWRRISNPGEMPPVRDVALGAWDRTSGRSPAEESSGWVGEGGCCVCGGGGVAVDVNLLLINHLGSFAGCRVFNRVPFVLLTKPRHTQLHRVSRDTCSPMIYRQQAFVDNARPVSR